MEKCIFVEYPSGYKGWQFHNPVTKKFIISEKAIFDKRSFPGLSGAPPVDLTPVGAQMNVPDALDSGGIILSFLWLKQLRLNQNSRHSFSTRASTFPLICSRLLHLLRPQLKQTFLMSFWTLQMHHSSYSLFPPPPAPVPAPARAPRAPRPPKGTIQPTCCSDHAPKPPKEWWIVPPAPAGPAPSQAASESVADDEESQPYLDDDMEEVQFAGAVPPPQTHTITDRPFRLMILEHWKEATLAEYNTLLQNGTWEIVDLPPGEKAIGSSWVFRIKRQSDGSIKRYKARIVAPDKTISKCTGLLRVL